MTLFLWSDAESAIKGKWMTQTFPINIIVTRDADGTGGIFTVPTENGKKVPRMADCFSKSELTDFCNLMKLPDGTPLLPIDMLDWLVNFVGSKMGR